MNTFTPFVLISAEQANRKAAENARATEQLAEYLLANGFTFSRVVGAYQGVLENTFAVSSITPDRLLGVAGEFGQECIMFVDSARLASLHYPTRPDETVMLAGRFRAVTEAEALASVAFTEINGIYYVMGGV
jgi:hypothetical protein